MLCVAVATVAAAGLCSGAAASADRSRCNLPNELRQAGLLNEAAARYHAIERAAGGRAAAPSCVELGLGLIADERHRRAAQIGDAVAMHNSEVTFVPVRWQPHFRSFARLVLLPPAAFRQPLVALTASEPAEGVHRLTIDAATRRRMALAASVGRADLIPAVVAHGIERNGGWYGLEIARVLVRAHYPLVAAAVVEATVNAHPALRLPPLLRSLVAGRRDAAAALRADARRRAAEHQIAAAKAYSRAGLDQQSEDAVARAIELDPRVEVTDEIRSPRGNVRWWNSVRGHFGSWLRTIVEMLIAVLALSVLLLLVARGLRRFRARAVVEPFKGEPQELGVAMTAAVREACATLRGAGGHRLKTVTSSGEAFDAIPRELANVSEPAGNIAALLGMIGRLVPARTRRITGQVRPRDKDRGAGLTVTFGRHGKVFEEQTLWERDFGRPLALSRTVDAQQSYDCLALPAAVWLTFASANHTLWRGFRSWIGWPGPFDPLGTDEWSSFAHFAVGAELQGKGEWERAEQAYHRALGIDPRNRGAALNLAGIELRDPSTAGQVDRALDRLADVSAEISDNTADELWFRVRYCTAIGHLGLAPRTDEARGAAVELCAEILDQRPWRRSRLPHLVSWLPHALDQLLRKLDWLLWGLYRIRVPANVEKADRAYLCGVLPSALLFLASALQQDPGRPDGDRTITFETLRKALGELRNAPDSSDALARFDQAVTHSALVDFVVRKRRRQLSLTAEALYNRACYEARVVEADPTPDGWAEVSRHLHEAMRRGGPGLAKWALEDPTLKEFRSEPARLAALRKVEREVCA
jgi:tetratricopeptide (TPR) repeat protein